MFTILRFYFIRLSSFKLINAYFKLNVINSNSFYTRPNTTEITNIVDLIKTTVMKIHAFNLIVSRICLTSIVPIFFYLDVNISL